MPLKIPGKNSNERFEWLMSRQNYVCKFTSKPFTPRGENSPHADHCHNTARFRGFVLAAVNRFLGSAEYIMELCNWDIDQLCTQLKTYLADPGIDIGLQPYPKDIGYATEDEAIAAYELSQQQHAPTEIKNKFIKENLPIAV